MFWLIETQEQFQQFKEQSTGQLFVHVVNIHPEIHPAIYTPICLYIRDLHKDKSYILNLLHPEATKLDITQVREYLKGASKIYTPDKKVLNYFVYRKDVHDLNLTDNQQVKVTLPAIDYFTQRYSDDSELNLIIPIVKHYEYCEKLYAGYIQKIKTYQPNDYTQDLIDVFWFIERNALNVSDTFDNYFQMRRPFLSRIDQCIYTHYNLNTITGRPSNTFNNINFAALNKDNGCRSAFIPRNDFLIEIDLTAYHPTLISHIVGYQSPTGDVYEDFAQQYQMERGQAKTLVFKQLYGHVYDEYRDFKLFQLATNLIDETWKEYTAQGSFTVKQTGKIFKSSELGDMNAQKLFNYYIQNLETYNNVQILKPILHILNHTESKVVLYVYDSIVIDVCKEDEKYIRQVIDIFNNKDLKIKVSYGKDYGTLQLL